MLQSWESQREIKLANSKEFTSRVLNLTNSVMEVAYEAIWDGGSCAISNGGSEMKRLQGNGANGSELLQNHVQLELGAKLCRENLEEKFAGERLL